MPAKDKPEDELIREKMWVSRPQGTHLSQSHKQPGDFSPLTRSDNAELGHVTLSPVSDEDEDRPDAEPSYVYVYNETSTPVKSKELEAFEKAVSDQVSRLIDYGIAKAKPHVQRFWQEKARPAIQSKWENRPRRQKSRRQIATSEPIVVDSTVLEPAQELKVASEDYRSNMTSTEAQARYVLALAAKEFSEHQMRLVVNATIEDDEGFNELRRAFSELPPAHVALFIEKLEANPSLLLDAEFDLGQLLGLAPADGDYFPIAERQDE